MFYRNIISTPIGDMVAIADNDFLYHLAFCDQKVLEQRVQKLSFYNSSEILDKNNDIILSIKKELSLYFSHELQNFLTPTKIRSTTFQNIVWGELQKIPYGKTISYKDQSRNLGREKSYRAVANANAINPLAIIVPCHRVIASNGSLGGYNGGVFRKQWLLEHEARSFA